MPENSCDGPHHLLFFHLSSSQHNSLPDDLVLIQAKHFLSFCLFWVWDRYKRYRRWRCISRWDFQLGVRKLALVVEKYWSHSQLWRYERSSRRFWVLVIHNRKGYCCYQRANPAPASLIPLLWWLPGSGMRAQLYKKRIWFEIFSPGAAWSPTRQKTRPECRTSCRIQEPTVFWWGSMAWRQGSSTRNPNTSTQWLWLFAGVYGLLLAGPVWITLTV